MVRIVQPDGKRTTVAAIRDGDVHADGLTFDDLVDVIRQRAGLDTVEVPADVAETADVAEPPRTPLVLRPSRRPLLWLLPVAGLCAWGGYRTLSTPIGVIFAGYLLMAPVLFVNTALKLLAGRTEATAGGLRNRLIFTNVTVDWKHVDQFVISHTLFGRVLRVTRRGRLRPLTLAAPREGLLASEPNFRSHAEALRALAARHRPTPPAITEPVSRRTARIMYAAPLIIMLALVVGLTRPWYEPWWPGQELATELPAACQIAQDASARHAPGVTISADQPTFCWRDSGNGESLNLDVELHQRELFQDGTDEAREWFDEKRGYFFTTTPTPVRGVGDQALREVDKDLDSAPDHRLPTVRLLVRRANVTIEVTYQAHRPAEELADAAIAIARAAANDIPVR